MSHLYTLPLDVHRKLKQLMNFQQLADVSVTHRMGLSDARFELRRRVERQLLHFRLQPHIIFPIMKSHGAVISGSVALAALFPDEETFFGGDIDFYVNGESILPFIDDVVARTKYEIVKDRSVTPTAEPSAAVTSNAQTPLVIRASDDRLDSHFQPSSTNHSDTHYPCIYAKRIIWLRDGNGDARAMNIIETYDDDPFRIISTFYSTTLMNAITHLGVVCLYPELTMARLGVARHSVLLIHSQIQANVAKYAARGFNIASSWGSRDIQTAIGPHECGQARCCPWTVRDTRVDGSMLWMAFQEYAGTSRKEMVPPMRWAHHITYDMWEPAAAPERECRSV